MSGETVPMERFRELVKTNEKHYGEMTQLKADNTQLRKEVESLQVRLAEVAQERDDAINQRDEFQQHEIHTHNILSAILGKHDSIESLARNLVNTLHQRDTTLDRYRVALEKCVVALNLCKNGSLIKGTLRGGSSYEWLEKRDSSINDALADASTLERKDVG